MGGYRQSLLENDYNDKHPEIEKGEVFYTNVQPGYGASKYSRLAGFRIGKVAYDCGGRVQRNLVPVFRNKDKE